MIRLFSVVNLLIVVLIAQAKPVEIVLWHSLAGDLGIELHQLVKTFNQQQPNYAVKLVYKGEYTETITSFAAAFQAHQPPAIVQIFEVGTATMLQPRGIIKPVSQLMQEQNLNLPINDFMPAISAFYSSEGQLVAMPFNSSIPVMYYNADALQQLGYSQESFPQTWDEFAILAAKLQTAGFNCAYTTAYPAWIQIESFAALHGLAGNNTSKTRAAYQQALIAHISRLKKWQQQHWFEYGGRASDATVLFTSGRCPLFSQSSGSYKSLVKLVNFRLGIANMPLDPKLSAVRHNNVVGGGSFLGGCRANA